MSCFLRRGTTRVSREQLCAGLAWRSQPSPVGRPTWLQVCFPGPSVLVKCMKTRRDLYSCATVSRMTCSTWTLWPEPTTMHAENPQVHVRNRALHRGLASPAEVMERGCSGELHVSDIYMRLFWHGMGCFSGSACKAQRRLCTSLGRTSCLMTY